MFDVTLADEYACPIVVVVDIIDLDISVADSWKRFVDSFMTASSLTAWRLLQRLATR